jgi:tetratricopeptide (TPR) repeat protein
MGAGRRRQAVATLERFIASPVDPEAYMLLGDLLLAEGRGVAARIAVYEKGVKANPDDLDLRLRLARAYVAQGNTKMAKDVYLVILELDPNNDEARKALEK